MNKKSKNTSSIVVCYYDPKYNPQEKPEWTPEQKQTAKRKWIVKRCSGEIISLCEQLSIMRSIILSS